MSEEEKQLEKKNEEEQQIKQLEEWTGMKCDEILFDCYEDDFFNNISLFFDKIEGRKQLIFLFEDECCEKFGFYLNTRMDCEYNKYDEKEFPADCKSFLFNLESNGRLNGMMKFKIKDTRYGCYMSNESDEYLIVLGNIFLFKDNKGSKAFCIQEEDWFDYQGITNALCGRTCYEDENGEWEGEYFTPLRIQVIQMEMIEEQKQIEEMSSLECGETIFDNNNLVLNEIEFNELIIGRKQLVFLIENLTGDKFGYYLNTEIKNKYNETIPTDSNSFKFELKSKEQLKLSMKYEIKNINYEYTLFEKENNYLIRLGDIIITKENLFKHSQNFQKDSSYNNGIENSIPCKIEDKDENNVKSNIISPKRIQIIQMEMTEEQRRIEYEKKKEEKQRKQFEEWTRMRCGEIIFDSDKDNWKQNESVFDDKVKGRKQLLFIIENDYYEKFGYYLNTDIKNEYNEDQYVSTDAKSFLFSIESNERLNIPMKFPIKNTFFGYKLYDKPSKRLIELGDIVLYKENKGSKSYWKEDDFEYQGIRKVLYGPTKRFTPQRIQVIQMEISEELIHLYQEKESKQIQQLEEWTGLKYRETVFDSYVDKWSKYRNEFDERIYERKQLVFIIEDLDGEIFGYYLNTVVIKQYKEQQETDDKSFEFNLESNGRLNGMMKFDIRDQKMGGYQIYYQFSYELIKLGDIVLYKNDYRNQSYCCENENNFEYQGIGNALCGKPKYFTPLRIQVIQMEMTEEQKRIEQEKEKKQIQQLEEWTRMKYGDVIFDSDIDNWSIDESEFNERIIGRKHLVFVIEDDHCEKFGYYLNTKVNNEYNDYDEWIYTNNKSFEFNIESNGRLKSMMKFPIKKTRCGYKSYDKSDKILIILGNIVLWKDKKRNSSYCEQNEELYNYQRISNAICGRTRYQDENGEWKGECFIPMRIQVIQMI